MIKLSIKNIEEKLCKKLKRNYKSIGLDLATKSGIGFVSTDNEFIYIDWTVLYFQTDNKKDLYKFAYEEFGKIITDENKVIIEDIFVGGNRQVALFLARLSSLALAQAISKGKYYEIISAISSRSKIGINIKKIPKGESKIYIKEWMENILGIKIDEDNVVDGILLALVGLCEDTVYTKKAKTKKKGRK